MKKYVFEEYRDTFGTGNGRVFNSKEEAVSYAKDQWNGLCNSDKKTYKKDICGTFRVYEIEISDVQLAELEDGCLDTPLSELWTEDLYDALLNERMI